MSDIVEMHRAALEREREDLLREGKRTSADRRAVILDQQSVGRLSRMDAMQQQSMAQAQERRRQARLKAIDAAFIRIADGEFGFCDDCGEEISHGRLEQDPTALRCIDCARG